MHKYCRTCHSFQGSTAEEAITIFDHKFAYASSKWLYTAVTRATDLKKVYFYDYDENAAKERDMIQHFTKKVQSYVRLLQNMLFRFKKCQQRSIIKQKKQRSNPFAC